MQTPQGDVARKSLREEHAARTRQRLLDAAVSLLVTDGAGEFSLREVAKRAGVSAPTAYRHFPTKEAMYDALQTHFEALVGDLGVVSTVDALIEALPTIHDGFQANAQVATAYVRSRAAHDLRDTGRARRSKRVSNAVRASLPGLSGDDANAFAALLQLFASTSSWEFWRDTWRLEGARAGRLAAWSARTLFEAVRKNPRAFAAALSDDAGPPGGKR